MRKVMLAALAGLGFTVLAAPGSGQAAVFSVAPAIQAAGAVVLDQAAPVQEVRSRRRNRSRSRSSTQGSAAR